MQDRRGSSSSQSRRGIGPSVGRAGSGRSVLLLAAAVVGVLAAGLGLAADEGLVVSAVIGDGRSQLRIRDVESGRLLTTLRTPGLATRGLLVGRRLFWTGPGDPSRTVDAGVWTADLATPAPAP